VDVVVADSRPRLYLDSSALSKLVIAERESRALRKEIGDRRVASSELALTELPRAFRRALAGGRVSGTEHRVWRLLDEIYLVPLHRGQLLKAGWFEEPWLESLDAIHLAAALSNADAFDAFVTYDQNQARAVKYAGLRLLQPA
jgi:predicted nucleic acid-binding protein